MGSHRPLSTLEPNRGFPVVALATRPAPVYRPRMPRQSPLYQTIERFLPEFERTYDQRYAKQYGSCRPIIGEVARSSSAAATCTSASPASAAPTVQHEMFVAFCCR